MKKHKVSTRSMSFVALLVLAAVLFSGCVPQYVQVFETKSTNTKLDNEYYVFENDTVKVTYSFWEKNGIMTFAVFNKQSKPIYIDWRKSSYIDNSVKLNYWVDEVTTNSKQYYGSYYYSGPLIRLGYASSTTVGSSVTTTVKPERVTFIPPNSNYYRSQFYLLPGKPYPMNYKGAYTEVPLYGYPKKKTKIFEKTFEKDMSPLVFRNFITLSFSEDMRDEFYVDNEFFISSVKDMNQSQFSHFQYDESNRYFKRDEMGNYIRIYEYKLPTRFYKYVGKY